MNNALDGSDLQDKLQCPLPLEITENVGDFWVSFCNVRNLLRGLKCAYKYKQEVTGFVTCVGENIRDWEVGNEGDRLCACNTVLDREANTQTD